MTKEYVKNYYQGIFLTETILGNPNGDFLDNSPRNFDGNIFTTDKVIKYNVRKYIHETKENLDTDGDDLNKNILFFYPRLSEDANEDDSKYLTRDDVYKSYFNSEFSNVKKWAPDVRMFGGTFSFSSSDIKSIYGPIQLSYGVDINNAQIKRLQIGAPFSTESGKQTTNGSEYVVDDAIISYDITVNPNSHTSLLLEDDLNLFKESLWFGTNLRKSTSKKTDSKLLILIKFKNKNSENGMISCINLGELKTLVSIENKSEHKKGERLIKINLNNLLEKLDCYNSYIESVEIIHDKLDVEIIYDDDKSKNIELSLQHPIKLIR